MLEGTSDGVLACDGDGNILWMNGKARTMCGLAGAEPGNVAALGIDIDVSQDRSAFECILAGEADDRKEVLVNAVARQDGTSILFLQDVSERRRLDSKLMLYSEQMEEMVAEKIMQLNQRVAEMENLYTLSEKLKYSTDLDEMLDQSLQTAISLPDFDGVAIIVKESEQMMLGKLMQHGKQPARIRISLVPSLKATLLEQGSTPFRVLPLDAFNDYVAGAIPDDAAKASLIEWARDGTKFVSIPLLSRGRLLGVFFAYTIHPVPWSNEVLDSIMTLVNTLSMAMENAMLYQDVLAAYEQLKELDELRTEFVDIAAHELRTPLTAIKAFLDMMMMGSLGTFADGEHEQLEALADSADDLNRMVTNLLDFSRIQSKEWSLTPEVLDAKAFIEGTVETLAHLARSKGQSIEMTVPDGLNISGDPYLVKRVFLNLLSNAIKYTPHGGRIRMSGRKEGELARFEVTDTGMGIDEKDLPFIFDRFYTADTSLTKRGDQMGLGLAICKSIVEKHGGEIWADSHPGRGSSFYFTMPLSQG